MVVKYFRIQIRRSRFWFWVYVYSDVHELRAGISNYDKKTGYHDKEDNNTVTGICHRYTRERLKKIKKREVWSVIGNIGTIRLAKTHLTTEIVSHEVVHAALWLYVKTKGRGRGGLTFSKIEREEAFAYIFGELYECMERKLVEKKLWTLRKC